MNQVQPYQPNTAANNTTTVAHQATVPSIATTLKDESWTLKEKIVYGLLAAVGVGGTLWIGKKIILKVISNKEELKSFEDGTPATTAKQIKMAFENDGWWGTNTEALREALISVSSQEDWQKIITSYKKQYNNANLIHDLSDELQSTELNEMMQIINSKPLKKGQASKANQYRAWAKRLKASFDKSYGFLPGTDSVAVTVTLEEIPTQAAFIKVGVEYKTLYKTNILDDLKGEAEFGQYNEWLQIIVKKRKS